MLCSRLPAHASLLPLQVVATTSRIGAIALEQRVSRPEIEALPSETNQGTHLGSAGFGDMPLAPRAPNDALAGVDKHALVLRRDFGPMDGFPDSLEYPVCVQFDGGKWQRGILVLHMLPKSDSEKVRQDPSPSVQVTQAAMSTVQSSPATSEGTHVAPTYKEVPSAGRRHGYVLVDAIPTRRAILGTLICDINSGVADTVLLRGEGMALVVPRHCLLVPTVASLGLA